MPLTPDILLSGYCQGYFPMAGDDGEIGWYDADPRAIIPLDAFHIPRRLARRARNGSFEIRFDYDFRAVMAACAEPRDGDDGTWISPEMIDAYSELHQLGFAHSVEAWRNPDPSTLRPRSGEPSSGETGGRGEGRLVGGLYGVAIRGLFAGESMFSRETDASKVALVYLVERLRRGGFTLLDSQYVVGSAHMLQFGAIEIPRAEYRRRLREALLVDATF